MHLKVNNAYLSGRTVAEISDFLNRDVVFSRLFKNGEYSIPTSRTVFDMGDEVLVACAEADAPAIQAFIGPELETEWEENESKQPLVSRRIVVTNPSMNGKTLGKMHFSSVYGVTVTRLSRQGMDLFASRNYRFQVGDKILVVGPEDNVNRIADPELNAKIEAFEYKGLRVNNFEMESSALAGLSLLLGHKALTCCMVIANRRAKRANTGYKSTIDNLIKVVLDRI